MHTHQLTNELFNDLLDPRIPTLDVCRKHAIPITDLRLILASDHFQQSAQALIEAEELRAAALAPDRRERALATLDAITQQQPSTPTHTECIRRAASALLRATKPDARPARTPAAAPEPTAPNELEAASPGLQGGAGEVPERSAGGGGSWNHQTQPALHAPTTSDIPEPSALSA
jgi:hypothetical protein